MLARNRSWIRFVLIFACALSFAACNRKAVQAGAGDPNDPTGKNKRTKFNPYATTFNDQKQVGGLFTWGINGAQGGSGEGLVNFYNNVGGQLVAVTVFVALNSFRCSSMGDGNVDGSLTGVTLTAAWIANNGLNAYDVQLAPHIGHDIPRWLGRHLWGMRHFAEYMDWYKIALNARMENGNPLALYPVYGKYGPDGHPVVYVAPTNPNAGFVDANNAAFDPEAVLLAFCVAGCFSPDQVVQVPNFDTQGDSRRVIPIGSDNDVRKMAIEQAEAEKIRHIMTLTKDSKLDRLAYQFTEVKKYTKDIDPGKQYRQPQDFVTLHFAKGGSLTTTTEHPILTTEGDLKVSSAFKSGEFVLDSAGNALEISKVQTESRRELAYNMTMNSNTSKSGRNMAEHLTLAGKGAQVVVGTKAHQDLIQGLVLMNRILLRHGVNCETVDACD